MFLWLPRGARFSCLFHLSMFSPGLAINDGFTGLLPLLSITGKSAEGEAFSRTCHQIRQSDDIIKYHKNTTSKYITSCNIRHYQVVSHIFMKYHVKIISGHISLTGGGAVDEHYQEACGGRSIQPHLPSDEIR